MWVLKGSRFKARLNTGINFRMKLAVVEAHISINILIDDCRFWTAFRGLQQHQ